MPMFSSVYRNCLILDFPTPYVKQYELGAFRKKEDGRTLQWLQDQGDCD